MDVFTYTAETAEMTVADEVASIEAAQAGDERAYERLLEAYGPALRHAVGRAKSMDAEDAQGAALETFVRVVYSHDPHSTEYRDGRLAPRLVPALRKALGEAMAAESGPLAVPARTFERYYGILNAANGDVQAAYDLAPSMGMRSATFAATHATVAEATRLGQLAADADGQDDRAAAQSVLDTTGYEPYSAVEDRILIDVAFGAITDTEARIIELKYAFTEYEEQTDAEIGHRLGLSRPTVQRKHAKSLDKMRKALNVTPERDRA